MSSARKFIIGNDPRFLGSKKKSNPAYGRPAYNATDIKSIQLHDSFVMVPL